MQARAIQRRENEGGETLEGPEGGSVLLPLSAYKFPAARMGEVGTTADELGGLPRRLVTQAGLSASHSLLTQTTTEVIPSLIGECRRDSRRSGKIVRGV